MEHIKKGYIPGYIPAEYVRSRTYKLCDLEYVRTRTRTLCDLRIRQEHEHKLCVPCSGMAVLLLKANSHVHWQEKILKLAGLRHVSKISLLRFKPKLIRS